MHCLQLLMTLTLRKSGKAGIELLTVLLLMYLFRASSANDQLFYEGPLSWLSPSTEVMRAAGPQDRSRNQRVSTQTIDARNHKQLRPIVAASLGRVLNLFWSDSEPNSRPKGSNSLMLFLHLTG